MPENYRSAFRDGIKMLLNIQHEIPFPPNHLQVTILAQSIIRDSGLEHDPRREYFTKLAKSALLGREPMYWNFKNKRRKVK